MGTRIWKPEPLRVPEGVELPPNFDPSSAPRSFREASLRGEGFKGGFGMSPENAYQQSLRLPSYKKLAASSKTPEPRHLVRKASADFPEIRQVEMAPSVKGLSDIQNVVTQTPQGAPTVPKSIRKPSSGAGSTAYAGSRNKATPEIVRDIRKIAPNVNPEGVKAAMVKYPQLHEATVRDIIRRNSWGHIK